MLVCVRIVLGEVALLRDQLEGVPLLHNASRCGCCFSCRPKTIANRPAEVLLVLLLSSLATSSPLVVLHLDDLIDEGLSLSRASCGLRDIFRCFNLLSLFLVRSGRTASIAIGVQHLTREPLDHGLLLLLILQAIRARFALLSVSVVILMLDGFDRLDCKIDKLSAPLDP